MTKISLSVAFFQKKHFFTSIWIHFIIFDFFFFFFRSTGIFVFVYAVFYYNKRSNMSGFLQSVQFFGYTLLACYIFFLMLGTVSFFASLYFVKYIYRYLKMDWVIELAIVYLNIYLEVLQIMGRKMYFSTTKT